MHWQYVMIHHSLTADGQTVNWDAIKKYHIETQGWKDIGYHYGIESVRNIYQVMLGRDLNTAGAHCKHSNMNSLVVGICVVGNYDLKAPDNKLLDFLAAAIVLPLLRKYNIPIENVVAHHDYTPYKTCPGKLFSMETFRQSCKRML